MRATAVARVRVGRTVVRLTAPRPLPALALGRRERPFAATTGATIELGLEVGPLAWPEDPPLFDSDGLWRVWRRPGGWLYAFSANDGSVGRQLEVDERLERGTLTLAPGPWTRRRAAAWAHPVLEMLVHHHLLRHRGLIVHASAVRIGRRVVLFSGHSGAGKSTLARLFARHAPDAEVLADDRVVVQPGPSGALEAWGTPWTGQGNFGSPRGGTLRGLVLLEQADAEAIEPLPRREAALRIYPLAMAAPFDAATVSEALASCDRLVRRVPTWRFRLRRHPDAVAAARTFFRAR